MKKKVRKPRKAKGKLKDTVAPKHYPGTREVSRVTGLSARDVGKLARLKGAPLVKGGGRGHRFASIQKAVQEFLLELPRPELVTSDPPRWKPQFWAKLACPACAKVCWATANRKRHGEFRSARLNRTGSRVVVFCWCSAEVGRTAPGLVHPEDLKLMQASS